MAGFRAPFLTKSHYGPAKAAQRALEQPATDGTKTAPTNCAIFVGCLLYPEYRQIFRFLNGIDRSFREVTSK